MQARDYGDWSEDALRLRITDLEARNEELRKALAWTLLGLKTSVQIAEERIETALAMAPKGFPTP